MNLIVCVDSNWGIGYKNELLVRIPSDQKFFRETTTGKVVVMGRKTLDSFPGQKPLKNRTNIVITSNKSLTSKDGEIYVHSIEECLELLKEYNDEDIFIIGGSSVYKEFLDDCDKCIVTFIDKEYEADAYFPNLDQMPEWELTEESDEQVYFDLTYTYRIYTRK